MKESVWWVVFIDEKCCVWEEVRVGVGIVRGVLL